MSNSKFMDFSSELHLNFVINKGGENLKAPSSRESALRGLKIKKQFSLKVNASFRGGPQIVQNFKPQDVCLHYYFNLYL